MVQRLIWLGAALLLIAPLSGTAQGPEEQRIVDLTNQARSQAGLKPVIWDAYLAEAARAHAELMAKQPDIAHRYQGEDELSVRASRVGAKFSVIAENIAQGTSPAQVQGSWMASKAHHDNLMNADIDHIGVGLVRARGALYAVVDFSRGVAPMSPEVVESKVGAILAAKGLTLDTNATPARTYCALNDGQPSTGLGLDARFLMRWQSADIATLPPQLQKAVDNGQFKQAVVGACEPKANGEATAKAVFSGYRVAVLLR